MNMLAQIGWQRGQRVYKGLEAGAINGFIFSPRDETPDRAGAFFAEIALNFPKSLRLFDPQLYALTVAGSEKFDPKRLEEYAYFPTAVPTRRELAAEGSQVVHNLVAKSLEYQADIGANILLAPNILVPSSVDSIWGAISRRFISLASSISNSDDYDVPVYASLILDSNALANRNNMTDLMSDLTGNEMQPAGYYIIISFPEGDLWNVMSSDVLANWLYLVHALTANGMDVIVGYTDYLTSFLGLAGASGGATGWFDNLRKFSITKFTPEKSGGRFPNPRYSSPVLYNRVLLSEIPDAMRRELMSKPDMWKEYIDERASLEIQILQHWWAISNTCDLLGDGGWENKYNAVMNSLGHAETTYQRLRRHLIQLDPKSESSLLDIIRDGLAAYKRLIA